MQYKNKPFLKQIVATLILASATPALAQAPIGSMAYGPLTEVPVGGGVFLIILGGMLALLAVWKITRGGTPGNLASAALLAIGAIAFSMAGGQVVHHAYAAISTTPLSNPNGGTVDLYSGYAEYENTSGAPLVIGDIEVDACGPADVRAQLDLAYPECATGLTLAEDGEICFTDFSGCLDDSRVTQQGGYYWVRADYPAASGDHAAVCAEFGLSPTSSQEDLTWDSTLLGNVAADFGYANGGDTACCAELMSCWDGDGFGADAPGTCSTHNFGSQFWNYGAWSDDPDERPVFTCLLLD